MTAVLRAGHPLPLLLMASTMLDALDPRHKNPFSTAEEPAVPLVELLASLVAGGPETGALAWAIALLSGDDLARTTVLRELLAFGDRLPDWVDRLDEVVAVAAVQTLDTLRDDCDVVVEVRLGDAAFCVVALVDFNLGAVVKDGFAREITLNEFVDAWTKVRQDDGGQLEPLSLADARARIEEAVRIGARTWPPPESEEWPQTRPLLEWVLRHLPEGGSDFDRSRLSDRRRGTLGRRFLASEHAPQPESVDDAEIVSDLLWYRTDWGYGDALRWSPSAVEILLVDWYPRKIVADAAYLDRMPALLRGLVTFAHARAKVPQVATIKTQSAIDHYEPFYRDAVSRRRAQGVEALLERLGFDADDDSDFPEDLAPRPLRALVVDQVGGVEAFLALDEEPLPDEAFRWAGVPDELHDAVGEVLRLCEAACEALLPGVEQRTAVRRLLRDVVDVRPAMFGRGSLSSLAAAVVWLVDKANEAEGRVSGDALLGHFGLKSLPSTRTQSIRMALDSFDAPTGPLSSARYLGSAQRHYLLLIARADIPDADGPEDFGSPAGDRL